MGEPSSVLPLMVSSWGEFGPARHIRAMGGSFPGSSTSWVTANLAMYIPFFLPWPYPIARMFWGNGSAAGGNWAISILDSQGLILDGSSAIAGSGNSTIQYYQPSVPLICQGRIYLGLTHSATTANQVWGANNFSGGRMRMSGMLQQASVTSFTAGTFWSPASATATILPVCGFTRTAQGF